MKQLIFKKILEQLLAREPAELTISTDTNTYTRFWQPKERLILLGGGHIAQPLCQLGAMLDFQVTVVDDRPSFANSIRFPQASEVICDGFGNAIDHLDINSTDYVCVITRGHRHDGECLRHILNKEKPFYLGMIGSRRRVTGLMEQLKEEGYNKEILDSICAPIGLSIHAQTVTEIAVSIVAQLIEYRRKPSISPKNYLPHNNIDFSLLETLSTGANTQVFALVLDTKGSTPVKAGAMMAVNSIGQISGTIGGGCGEAEVMHIARKMVGSSDTKIVEVNMTNDIAEEEGMVCGGTMTVFLEAVTE